MNAAIHPTDFPASADAHVAAQIRGRMSHILELESSPLAAIANHANLNSGKLLRSRLLVAAAPNDEDAIERALDLCAILELTHLATLFHDDVLDAADTRRGGRTVRVESGNRSAILGGDYLLTKAMHHLSRTASLAAIRVVAQAVTDVFSGELRQHADSGRIDVELEHYLRTISLKTGALFRAACELAWIVADQPDEPSMAGFGCQAGLLYQLLDDHCDYFGDPVSNGKPIGQDFAAGIPTLPLILGLQSPIIGGEVRRIFCKTPRTPEDFVRLLTLMSNADIPGSSSAFIDAMAHATRGLLELSATRDRLQAWFDGMQSALAGRSFAPESRMSTPTDSRHRAV